MVTINFRKINPNAIIPTYAHPGDAGMDVYAPEQYTLKAGERKTFALGFQAELPEGFVAQVWDKSGLAANHGIKTMAGIIDANYRGEYKVVLLNTAEKDFEVRKGDKIAQLLIIPLVQAQIREVSSLKETSRGESGFGSTGR